MLGEPADGVGWLKEAFVFLATAHGRGGHPPGPRRAPSPPSGGYLPSQPLFYHLLYYTILIELFRMTHSVVILNANDSGICHSKRFYQVGGRKGENHPTAAGWAA